MNAAQDFVDMLNMKEMPQFGYVRRNDRCEWPNIFTGCWESREKWDSPLVSTGEKLKGNT